MRRIVWTSEAVEHLAIVAYISAFNPAAAVHLGERLAAAAVGEAGERSLGISGDPAACYASRKAREATMTRTERIEKWAQALGPWRVGVGLLGIFSAYGVIGLTFAGVHDPAHGTSARLLLSVLQIGTALALCASCTVMLIGGDTRRMKGERIVAPIVHVFFLSWLMMIAWSYLPVWRPSTPDDFRTLIFPLNAILFCTIALSMPRNRGREEAAILG